MTLTEEEFVKAYEQFGAGVRELRTAEFIHAYTIKRPNYHPTDSRLEPEGKKVILWPSRKLEGCGIAPVKRVLRLEGADFVKSLDEADIGVYIGEYLCDYGEDGSPTIESILNRVRDKDMEAVVFTNGNYYYRFCQGKCPEDKKMLDLIRQGKQIIHNPLGWPYNKCPVLT